MIMNKHFSYTRILLVERVQLSLSGSYLASLSLTLTVLGNQYYQAGCQLVLLPLGFSIQLRACSHDII